MHWLSHLGIKTPKRCKSTRHKLWPVIGPHVSGNVDSILLDGHVLTVAPHFSATSGPPFDTFVRVPDKEWTNSFLSFLPVVKSNVSYLFFWFSLAQKKVFSKASFLPKAWRTVWSTQFMKCNKCYREYPRSLVQHCHCEVDDYNWNIHIVCHDSLNKFTGQASYSTFVVEPDLNTHLSPNVPGILHFFISCAYLWQ